MSESSGAQDASTLVLRISIPAGAEYQAIVKELAAKVAAYLGDTDPDGRAAADALDEVTRVIRSGGPGAPVTMVRVTGRTTRTTRTRRGRHLRVPSDRGCVADSCPRRRSVSRRAAAALVLACVVKWSKRWIPGPNSADATTERLLLILALRSDRRPADRRAIRSSCAFTTL